MVRRIVGATAAVEVDVNTTPIVVNDLEGWANLSPSEKRTVQAEATAIDGELVAWQRTRLSIGRHLLKVREVLEPKRMFLAFLEKFQTKFDLSQRTFYRYMDSYMEVAGIAPPQAIEQAVEQGVELSSKAAKQAMRQAPKLAPNPSPQQTKEWLSGVERGKKVARQDTWSKQQAPKSYTPEESILEVVNLYAARFSLIEGHKSKQRFMESVVGMIMTVSGIGNPVAFSPIAVPEGVRGNGESKRRGRPKKSAQSAPIGAARPQAQHAIA